MVSIIVRRVGQSRRLRAEVSAEVTGLTLCYATYDARFRDTNLKGSEVRPTRRSSKR